MPKENIIQQTLKGKKKSQPQVNVWVDGRWIMYAPSHGVGSVAHEVKEWGGRWEKKHQAFRLPRLTRFVRKIAEFDPDAVIAGDLMQILLYSWETRDSEVFESNYSPQEQYYNLYPYQKE